MNALTRFLPRLQTHNPVRIRLALQHGVLFSWLIFCSGFLIAPQKPALGIAMYWLILVALVWYAVKRPHVAWNQPLLAAMTLFAAYFVASVAWGAHDTPWPLLTPLKFALALLIFMLTTQALVRRWPQLPEYLLIWLVYLGMAVALATLANYFRQLDSAQLHATFKFVLAHATLRPGDAETTLPRLLGLGNLRNPLVVASVLGCCGLLATDRLYRVHGPYARLSCALAAASCAIVVVLSQSRGPIVLLTVCLLLVGLIHARKWQHHVGLLVLVGVIVIPILFSKSIFLSLETRGVEMLYRHEIWGAIWREMPGHWLFGQGLRRNWDVVTPLGVYHHEHSVALGLLRFGGIVGLALFGHVVYRFFTCGARVAPPTRNALMVWFAFGLGCQLTNGSFPISHPHYHWFLLWLPIALMAAKAALPTSTATAAARPETVS